MTKNKYKKRAIRDRMAQTGENGITARRALGNFTVLDGAALNQQLAAMRSMGFEIVNTCTCGQTVLARIATGEILHIKPTCALFDSTDDPSDFFAAIRAAKGCVCPLDAPELHLPTCPHYVQPS